MFWQAHTAPGHGEETGGANDFVLFVYRATPSARAQPPTVCLPFLGVSKRYTLKRIDPCAGRDQTGPPAFMALSESGIDMDGAWLSDVGLPLPAMKAETALVIEGRSL